MPGRNHTFNPQTTEIHNCARGHKHAASVYLLMDLCTYTARTQWQWPEFLLITKFTYNWLNLKLVNSQNQHKCIIHQRKEQLNRLMKCWVACLGFAAAAELTVKHINKGLGEDVWVFVNECCSKWFLDCTAANTVWQLLSNVAGLILQIPLYSGLARVLKPTWHAEQQEIKLWSALVCRADLLPHCL